MNAVDNHEDIEDDDEEEEEDPLAHLPPYVIARVDKLQELQSSHELIQEQYLRDRTALEKKYEGLAQPLYRNRTEIVRGDHDRAIAAAASVGNMNVDDESNANVVQGIPQFWVASMMHMDVISELVSEDDVDCLEHLMDVSCNLASNGQGFTLSFQFAPNEYFSNSVLTKAYEVPNLLTSDEPLLKNVTGTVIDWKAGKSLTHRHVTKKQRRKGTGQVRTVTKEEAKESFFNWFTPPTITDMEMMDEDEAERLEELFENDFEVAQAFRSDIIPKAVLWFTGQKNQEELESIIGAMANVGT